MVRRGGEGVDNAAAVRRRRPYVDNERCGGQGKGGKKPFLGKEIRLGPAQKEINQAQNTYLLCSTSAASIGVLSRSASPLSPDPLHPHKRDRSSPSPPPSVLRCGAPLRYKRDPSVPSTAYRCIMSASAETTEPNTFTSTTSIPDLDKRDAPRTSKPAGQQHLYLIYDDWELGYSIRELNLAHAGGAEQRSLPPPFIRLEATPGYPEFFAAVGTKILSTHHRYGGFGYDPYDFINPPADILPIVDVRSRGVNFAPGELYAEHPIYLPVGDEEIFALDMRRFKMLSMKPLWPPRLEYEYRHQISQWSWVKLPMPTFKSIDVTSYAVDSDGKTILFSTANATFSFDTLRHEWKKRFEWPLPFSGHANFVHGLDVFVGLPKDVADSGRLCFCRWLGDDKHVWLSKENVSSKNPAEAHVGTTLVYLGGSRFCLVECIRNGDDRAVQKWMEKWQEVVQAEKWEELDQISEEGEGCPLSTCCRLTTFSLSSDMNGDLTAAKTAVQCYETPLEASDANPVAFWL